MSVAAVGVLSPFSRRSQSASCSGDKGMCASSIIAHNAFSWNAFLANLNRASNQIDDRLFNNGGNDKEQKSCR